MTNAVPEPTTRRALSPWMVIVGIALLAVVVTVGLAFAVVLTAPGRSPLPRGVAQATLDDGSLLVLHDVLLSSNRLELPVHSDSWLVRLGLAKLPTESFHAHSSGNGLVLWLSRHDARTGAPLPFDRWSHCIARTSDGAETWDGQYATRIVRESGNHHGSSSTGQMRPFSPLDAGSYSHILYASSLPLLRPQGTHFDLDVHHADQGLITTLHVPFPAGLGPFPTWTPQPLPLTDADGDVDVTLTKVSSQWHTRPSERPRREVRIDATAREDGEETAMWILQQVILTDALGNESYPYDCNLSSHESAWKVRMRPFRRDEARFPTAQRLVVEDVPLPDADTTTAPNTVAVGDTLTYDGVTLDVLGVGGPGPVDYDFRSVRTDNVSHYSGQGLVAEYNRGKGVVRVHREDRHVAIHIRGGTPDHRISLLLTDQNGVLQSTHQNSLDEVQVWTFEADEWVHSVNLYLVVQRARSVEFTIAPPSDAVAK